MTALLVRMFIKNATDTQNPQVRTAYGTLGATVGICTNVLLALTKLLLGAVSGSFAIVTDGVNSLSDGVGSLVSLASIRVAQKPRDREHPFGHGRMEYIGALGVGALITAMGFTLLLDGVQAIFHPKVLDMSPWVLALMGISLVVKVWLTFFYRTLGRAVGHTALLAASKDSLSDILATAAVLVSLWVEATFGWHIDAYIGVLVALVVLKTGIDVCRDTIGQLLGERPHPAMAEEITRRLLTYPGVLGVHDLLFHDYGPGRCVVSAHVEVGAKEDIVQVHEWIDRAEREIGQDMRLVLCLHMDPIVTGDKHTQELRDKLETFLRHMDSRLTLHDFRVVKEEGKTLLVFDCVLPQGYSQEGLQASLQAYTKTLDESYGLRVQFDIE